MSFYVKLLYVILSQVTLCRFMLSYCMSFYFKLLYVVLCKITLSFYVKLLSPVIAFVEMRTEN